VARQHGGELAQRGAEHGDRAKLRCARDEVASGEACALARGQGRVRGGILCHNRLSGYTYVTEFDFNTCRGLPARHSGLDVIISAGGFLGELQHVGTRMTPIGALGSQTDRATGLNGATETKWQRQERDLSVFLFESILEDDAMVPVNPDSCLGASP